MAGLLAGVSGGDGRQILAHLERGSRVYWAGAELGDTGAHSPKDRPHSPKDRPVRLAWGTDIADAAASYAAAPAGNSWTTGRRGGLIERVWSLQGACAINRARRAMLEPPGIRSAGAGQAHLQQAWR